MGLELKLLTKTSAKLRNEQQIKECAIAWVRNKYETDKKVKLRNRFMLNSNWKYILVHGNVKDQNELIHISQQGVGLIPFSRILDDLCKKQTSIDISGSSAGDLIEIINFLKVK